MVQVAAIFSFPRYVTFDHITFYITLFRFAKDGSSKGIFTHVRMFSLVFIVADGSFVNVRLLVALSGPHKS